MMNQGGNTQTVASLDPNLVENRYVVDASQSQTSYLPTTTGSGAVSWNTHVVDNHSIENGSLPNSTYHHEQQTEPLVRNVQEGVNATSVASSSNSGTIAVSQDYSGYTPYLNSSDPYSYGNTGYPGYYSSYQQQPNHSYSQPVGAYQNTGAPYQPISSFPNSGSYPGSASYSGTYYHPGDYQKAGSYPSSSYNNQLNSWNEGNYANYNPHQYTNYPADASDTYNSGTAAAPAPSLQYQQQYNQWTDYYGSTEVSCAPGTENMPVATTSNQVTAPGVTVGYQTTNSQPPTTYPLPWQQDSSSLQMPVLQPTAPINGSHDSYWKHGAPSFQNHHLSHLQSQLQKPMESKTLYDNFQEQQKVACPQGPNSPYPTAQQAPQNFQSPPVQTSLLDNRRASNLQIPTNPRIASNLAIGLQKTNKDSSATTAAKPAYVCISMPKPNEKVLSNDAADSILKPGMFPKSLRGYVERALGRCKDDTEMATCQAVMKEIITKATADGTLYTRDWDTEPLFPLPNGEMVNKDLQNSTPVSALSKYKRSPSRRTKSRWEPLPEEKSINKSASASKDAVKFSGWTHSNEKDKKPFSGNMSKENGLSNIKILLSEQKSANKSTQRPVKRQRVAADGFNALDNGDASSDSDKEQSLTSYHSGAIALVNSPEERMRRENRSKRFEKGQGNRAETNHFKPRIAGAGNLYDRRASALVISKNYEDGGSRAVEDIDWDALTVKGTCQEIEKRYLRLTSAPDPSTVRPEEVLEKALLMVQNSQKNYLYKCDQLKSIRQDLTVQRIRNHLTVRVYETHARLAIEYGDLPEYNQCQSQLKILYAEGIEGCQLEFSAYNLLCVILHSNNKRELLLGMSRLSNVAKEDEAVKHALAVRAAVTSGNYVMFFRLYKTAPNLNTYFMDLYVEKMRFKAVSCMSRSYRPMVPVSYIAQVLGFASVNEGCDEKDTDGVEECVEWLKAHGASLVADNNGDLQVDAKASSSSLFMPEPEDAVSHGDSNLAVNDFLTRASSSTS